ncbi:MAG: glycosyltransferase family 4 protein, partial [Chloroflexota bacterium]
MRILVLSNFYPPARPGGYTQWCHEVSEGLREKGHDIWVLTSRHEAEKAAHQSAAGDEARIYRLLHLDGNFVRYNALHFFTQWRQQKRENESIVHSVIRDVEPDLIFIWGMWAMSHAVPAVAEQLMPGRVVYFISDYWPASADMHTTYWQKPGRHVVTRPIRALLSKIALDMIAQEGRPALQFRRAICVSEAVRQILIDAGLPFHDAQVIHGGTRLNGFRSIRPRSFDDGQLKLLYAGQLAQHKGVHTAIEAVAKLVHGQGVRDVHLNVVGAGHPVYERSLARLVKRKQLDSFVTLKGRVDKEQMPDVLAQADVLLFPSIYEEPFARMTQEAMLAGLVVVGTTTGGTKEILDEGYNGLTFPAGDAEQLARQVSRLVYNPEFCRRLSTNARRTVLDNYTLDTMVARIEAYLQQIMVETDDNRTHSPSTGITDDAHTIRH